MKKHFLTVILLLITTISSYGEGQIESDLPSLEEIGYNPEGYPISQEPVQLEILVPMKPQMKNIRDMSFLWRVAEHVGVNLDVNSIPLSIYHQKKNLMFASGELPDIFWGMMSMTEDQVNSYGDDGVLLRLNPYIEQMPNLSNIIEQYPAVMDSMTNINGDIYALPFLLDGVKAPYRGKMYINKKWLETLNLPLPQTIDELTETLRAFKEQDPNRNGKADEIPIALSDVTPYTTEISGFPLLFGSFGRHGSGFIVEDGEVIYAPAEEEYKTAVSYFSNWYKEDLVNSDCFILNVLDYWKIYKSNDITTLGAVFVDQILQDVIPEDQLDEYTILPPLKGITGEQIWHRYYTRAFGGNIGASINANTPYPEIVLRYLDEFYKLENSVEVFLGSIDKAIEKDSNGNYRYKKVSGQTNQDLRYQTTTGDGPAMIHRDYINKGIIEDYNQLHNSLYREIYSKTTPSYILPALEYTEEEKETMAQISVDINNYVIQKRAEWITEGNIIDEWDNYINKLIDMGLNDLLSIKQIAFERSNLELIEF